MSEDFLKLISNTLRKLRVKLNQEKAKSAILTYHGVSETRQKNCVPVDIFKEHLAYLSDHYKVVSLSDLLNKFASNKEFSEDLVVLTFDDGYENFLKYAYPLLQKYQLPATVFIPAKLIDQYNSWDYDANSEYPYLKIMSLEELRSLDPELIEIGSHTSNHLRLSLLDDEQLVEEIVESKKILENLLQRDIKYFAYPYGELNDFDERAVRLISESNYNAALSTHFSRFDLNNGFYKIGRISVFDNDQADDLEAKLSGYYDWLTQKEYLAFKLKKIWKK